MQKTTKLIACVLLIMLVVATASYAEAKSVVPGYLLGILLGYGTGHFYLGDSAASLFLLTELGGTALVIGGSALYFATALSLDLAGAYTGLILIAAGAVVLEVFHIIEIIDIFRAADQAKRAGKVSENTLDLAITPTGFNVRYNF